jgi:hypothetical protein
VKNYIGVVNGDPEEYVLTRYFIAFACDVEGCGRHFSVVSNLRRHKKVHKGEKEGGSADEDE